MTEDEIKAIVIKYGHINPTKPQISLHKNREIHCVDKSHMVPSSDTIPILNDACIKHIHSIVGTLLYYGRTVYNKLLVGLIYLSIQKSTATKLTDAAANQLLDYVTTYPSDGTTYRASGMILAAHSDDGFNNKSKARSQSGAHIFLSKNDPLPRFNSPVLTVAQIINFVMYSEADTEIGGLSITVKEMVPLHQKFIEMGWPQPPYPIKTDNTTATVVVNNTIFQKKMKMMNTCFYWLCCQKRQYQFSFYWDAGSKKWDNYRTNNHYLEYHEAHRPTHAG